MSHYAQVPKTLVENLEYRRNLRKLASGNARVQRQLLEACEKDTLFFINTFAWVIEPRAEHPVLPLITWPTQDEYVLAMEDCIRRGQDLWVEKARAEGFTWMSTWVGFKWWLFRPMTMIGLGSKDKETADLPDDPGSLMGKFDWIVKSGILPTWMLCDKDWDRKKDGSTLKNLRNNSLVKAYAATDDMASGGRWTFGILDEFAKFFGDAQRAMDSTQYVTNCRVFGSTYKGRAGVFYEQINDPGSTVRKFVFDWTRNPTRNEGLYRVVEGKPVVLDDQNPVTQDLLDRYPGSVLGAGVTLEELLKKLKAKGFDLEGTVRSPWYDKECLRAPRPASIAEELDRNPQGAEEDFLPRELLRELTEGEERTVAEPKYRGKLIYDAETLDAVFVPDDTGDLLVWCDLEETTDEEGHRRLRPPKERQYTQGCDVSFGRGASNSSTTILDKETGEQAAEYTTAYLTPDKFARLSIALAKWFNGAYLGWEINGACGGTFTDTVVEVGYANVYYRKVEQVHGNRYKEQIGWKSSTNDKSKLLGGVDGGGLLRALLDRTVLVRSRECLLECTQYVILNGQVIHLKSKNTTRESAKGEAHGDRVIGLALAVHLRHDRPVAAAAPPPPDEPAYGSWDWRRREQKRETEAREDHSFTW